MAALDEKDEPLPLSRAFCCRLSKEEHEAVVSAETEKQLDSLLAHLEHNPKAFVEFLRQRKVSNLEKAGLFSNLKVKVLTALFGKDFVGSVDEETCRTMWKEFEETTIKTYNSSQEAKGKNNRFSRRQSKRIAEKQLLKEQSNFKIPSPPPLPPIQNSQTDSNNQDIHSVNYKTRSTATSATSVQDDTSSLSKRIVKRKPLREVSSNLNRTKIKKNEDLGSFCSELTLAKKNLRPIGLSDKTPYQFCKQRRESEGSEHDENRFPFFNQELIRKFQNARSPCSPAHSDHESPGRCEQSP